MSWTERLDEMSDHLNRDELVGLVRFILAGMSSLSEEEGSRLVERFEAAVPDPAARDLIFYPDDYFGHDLTAEEIVDAALGYRPFEMR